MHTKFRSTIGALGIAVSAVTVAPASASPTDQINGGYMLVEFLPGFVDALTSLGIAPSKNLPRCR